jgi:hypothetical protein
MDRNKLLSEEDYEYEAHMHPSYGSSDSNRNVRSYENGSYTNSGLRKQNSLNTLDISKKSFDLSSTFEQSQVVLGWEDINVFVHKETGFFDRCLKRGRGNIEFVVNQVLNGGNKVVYSNVNINSKSMWAAVHWVTLHDMASSQLLLLYAIAVGCTK